MLKILKASAGSGKTYNLAREYIRLLVASPRPDAYRHVLAVTFTNKATDEMKRRILSELSLLAREPERSPYKDYFVPSLLPDLETLRKRARTQLSGILHDYSSFAVSTIDRFFQQTLRAFSREIGQFSSYQVQLDHEALVEEGVDRVLDDLTEEDRTLLDWLTKGVKAHLENGGGLSLDGELKKVGKSLQAYPGADLPFSRERLEALHARCTALRKDFPLRVEAAAQKVLDVLSRCGVEPGQTNYHFLTALYNYVPADPSSVVKDLSPAFLAKAKDSSKWFSKAKDHLRVQLEGVLDGPLNDFCALFGTPYKEYMTARELQGQLYSLGVAGELREALVRIQKERNVLSLEDSNTILHGIIDGSDAPFVYEKLGVRFEDFLLDEFQDTSRIQWDNFSPLLHNSEASGFDSLVVGDVKQSIYRWRGSDWKLLGGALQEEFPARQTQVSALDSNFRTCRAIVSFNNDFFHFAAEKLDEYLGEDALLQTLYADVAQTPKFSDPAPGEVSVCFTEDQMQEILSTLSGLSERGVPWSGVAILVRDNKRGAEIAAALVEAGIPVVSDDSLFVKTSVVVRRLVSQMTLVERPENPEKPSVAGFLSGKLQLSIPAHYHSLTDLAEGILRSLQESDPALFQADIPYIQSFMDYLQDWVSTGGNNLGAFLRHWEQADPKIASPRSGNSVRIITVHKAKGLEFPYVIFPFAEKVGLYKEADRWCSPDLENTPLSGTSPGDAFYVNLNKGASRTLFEKDYREETRLQAIDNLNVFYVALTRPKYGLKVISAPPPKHILESMNAGSAPGWTSLSQLLYAFVGGSEFFAGAPYNFSSLTWTSDDAQVIPASFASYPYGSGNRLKFSPEAADYFGPDGSFGPQASRRIRGNVLHRILSRVNGVRDVEAAVEAAVQSGELPGDMAEQTCALLKERIASVASLGWFAPDARIRCEVPVIGGDGQEYRPDRVVLPGDGSACIVDYKFGVPEKSHVRQVERYKLLYRQLGYNPVKGYLWYFQENPDGKIAEV